MISLINKLKKQEVIQHMSVYFTSNFTMKGIDFLSVLVFARLMLPEKYGQIEIFRNLIAIVTALLSLKFSAGIKRYYFEKNSNINVAIFSSLVMISVFNIFSILLYVLILNKFINFDGIIFLLIIGYFNSIFELHTHYLQAKRASKKYLIINTIFRTVLISSNFIGIIILSPKAYSGYVISSAIAYTGIGAYSLIKLLRISKYYFDRKVIIYLLKFSLPMIPATISGFVLSYFDRIMIASFAGLSSSGIYSLSYNISLILNVLIISLNQSWQPLFYKLRSDEKYTNIKRQISLNSKIIMITATAIILFSKEIFAFFPGQYRDGQKLVSVITIGLYFTYIYSIYLHYATFHKKIIIVSINSIAASAINVILNSIYIPIYGYEAAAYTTLVSYIIMVIVYYLTVRIILEKNCYELWRFTFPILILIANLILVVFIEEYLYFLQFCIRVGSLAILIYILYRAKNKLHF